MTKHTAISAKRADWLMFELVACFSEAQEETATAIGPETNLFDLLEIPNRSLALLRIRLAVQKRLKIKLPAKGLEKVATIADLADMIVCSGDISLPTDDFDNVTDPAVLYDIAQNGIPINRHLGIVVENLHPEVRLVLPYRSTNTQHLGFLAAGAITAALDAAAALSIALHVDPSTVQLLTPDLKLEIKTALDHDMTAVSAVSPQRAAKLSKRVERMGHALFEQKATGFNKDGKIAAEMTATFYMRRFKSGDTICVEKDRPIHKEPQMALTCN
jgi:acyl-coenzyme A thioesterase PaaI-like protein/acyl carrier protein